MGCREYLVALLVGLLVVLAMLILFSWMCPKEGAITWRTEVPSEPKWTISATATPMEIPSNGTVSNGNDQVSTQASQAESPVFVRATRGRGRGRQSTMIY